MRLRRNQVCPIHLSRSCCGREVVPKIPTTKQLGVRRIEDPHHPRGYRELRSKWGDAETAQPQNRVAEPEVRSLRCRVHRL